MSSHKLMSWSTDFTKEVPTLSLPIGDDHVAVFGPDDAAVVRHILSEFLRDCSIHRQAPGAVDNRIYRSNRPDWGHGPNPPIQSYTEEQIRTAFTDAGQRAADGLMRTLEENRAAGRRRHEDS